MKFPKDVDGDVLRRLLESGLDFSYPQSIDFNVDFKQWPPSDQALKVLRNKFGDIGIYEPEDEDTGYVIFVVRSILTYELVMTTQKEATELMAQFGGTCESWGILH